LRPEGEIELTLKHVTAALEGSANLRSAAFSIERFPR
jgi:hypothetical protein